MNAQERLQARVAQFAHELSALVAEGIRQHSRRALESPPQSERGGSASSSATASRFDAAVDGSAVSEPDPPQRRARRTAEQLVEIQEKIIKLITHHPKLTSEEIQEHLGMQKSDVQRPLDLLREEGDVRTIGERRAMRYFVGAGKPGVVRRVKALT